MAKRKGSKPKGKVEYMKCAIKNTKLPRYSGMVRVALAGIKQPKGVANKEILNDLIAAYCLSETAKVKRALDIALMSGLQNGSLMTIYNRYKLVNTSKNRKINKSRRKKYQVEGIKKQKRRLN